MRWSEDDLKAYREGRPKIEPTKRHKFGARTTRRADGRTYASKLEAARAADLELQQRVGMIRNLREQVRYPLTDGTGAAYRIRSAGVPKGRRMTFIADFVYERQMPDGTWNEMIEDVRDSTRRPRVSSGPSPSSCSVRRSNSYAPRSARRADARGRGRT